MVSLVPYSDDELEPEPEPGRAIPEIIQSKIPSVTCMTSGIALAGSDSASSSEMQGKIEPAPEYTASELPSVGEKRKRDESEILVKQVAWDIARSHGDYAECLRTTPGVIEGKTDFTVTCAWARAESFSTARRTMHYFEVQVVAAPNCTSDLYVGVACDHFEPNKVALLRPNGKSPAWFWNVVPSRGIKAKGMLVKDGKDDQTMPPCMYCTETKRPKITATVRVEVNTETETVRFLLHGSVVGEINTRSKRGAGFGGAVCPVAAVYWPGAGGVGFGLGSGSGSESELGSGLGLGFGLRICPLAAMYWPGKGVGLAVP